MINKQNYYTKIPNKLFYSIEDGEDSILRKTKFNEKTLLILDYLYMHTNRRNKIHFYLKDMIVECGFSYSTKKGESHDQFKDILLVLHKINVIESEYDFSKTPSKELITCSLTIDLDQNYTQLYDNEKEKINGQTIDKVNNLKLLIYYCYLKCRMYKRPKDDSMVVSGGRAEVAYPSFKLINEDLGITDDSIDKYNNILIALDMIRLSSAGNWYYKDDPNKVLKDSCNFYTLFTNEEESEHNLKEGIKFWKKLDFNLGKVFTNSKEYKNNNKRLNGELGSIIKKEKNGTATEADIARKNEIINSINSDEGQFNIQALLDANPNTLLSSIYSGFNSDRKAEKYWDIENSLGLINDEDEISIDYEYYKWVMVNYNKDEHTYYVNCVEKHKRDKVKPKGLQNKKKVIKDDSAFIEEMGWEIEPEEENEEDIVDFSEFVDWSEEDEELFS